MKLRRIHSWKGTIELKTGLHIGAGDAPMRIGGTDNSVVKHPHSGEPYIPGSSLKGKVRALLELDSGLLRLTGGQHLSSKHLEKEKLDSSDLEAAQSIIKLFGGAADEAEPSLEIGPSRVAFADCPLSRESRQEAKKKNLAFTEIKYENTLNRITSESVNLRSTERVIAGLTFDVMISLRQFEGDEGLENCLLRGLALLQLDALGGSGSRGYGRIEFHFADEAVADKFAKCLQQLTQAA